MSPAIPGRVKLVESVTTQLLPVLIAVALAYGSTLQGLDRVIYDWGQNLSSRAPLEDIVIVAIDQQSLDTIGHWPWSRDVHGDLINILTEAGARTIGFDIVISDPTTTAADTHLANAIRNSGRVVLPVLNEQNRLGGQLREILPLPSLIEGAASLGHIDRPLDNDSISRSVYLKAGLGQPHWPSFALAVTLLNNPEFGTEMLPGVQNLSDKTISPLVWQRDFHLWLSYAGPPGHFKHVSYSDVLNGVISKQQLHDKLILVGATASGLSDILPTPVSGELRPMPGVEIIANEIDTLLTGHGIEPISLLPVLLITALLVLLTMILLPRLSPRSSLLVSIGSVVLTLVFTAISLSITHRWFPPSAAITGIIGGYIIWNWRRLVHAMHYLNKSLENLEYEPTVVSSHNSLNLDNVIPFITDILPISSGKLESITGEVHTIWNHQPDQYDSIGKFVWHQLDNNAGRFGVNWHGSEPPNPLESRLLTALGLRFTPSKEPIRQRSFDRMQRRIHQVDDATQRLQTMRKFINDTLSQMVDGVIVADNLGRILLANPSALHLLKIYNDPVMRDQSLQHYWGKLQFSSTDDGLNILRSALINREPDEIEASGPDGKNLRVQVVPFHYSATEEGIIIDIVDITAIKNSEQRRRDILTFLSHDLRSPLASILAITELIQLDPERLKDGRYMERIAENAQRSLNLADGFLNLLNAENTDIGRFQPVDLVATVNEASTAMLDQAENKQISIEYLHDEAVYVLGSANLLERVFTNLLSNAIKFSPNGTKILISTKVISGMVLCNVQDRGYGIKTSDLPKLFERFERIHRKEHQHEHGSGLGLVFVKTVIEQHKGKIWVESVVDKGTKVSISIPSLSPKEIKL